MNPNTEAVIKLFKRAAVDDHTLAARLQRDGVAAFAKSCCSLLSCIAAKSAPPAPVRSA